MIHELNVFYGNESNFNVVSKDDEEAVFPSGGAWAICTNWSAYVRRIEGDRCKLFGYDEVGNPNSEISRLSGGHDFAVVDDRYVVDGWVRNVECLSDRAAFDMEDDLDMAIVRKLYGDPSNWQRNEVIEASIDRETPDFRTTAMAGVASREPASSPAP